MSKGVIVNFEGHSDRIQLVFDGFLTWKDKKMKNRNTDSFVPYPVIVKKNDHSTI